MKNHLIFTDIETGGLNGRLLNGELGCDYLPIFEIAIIVTDTDLNELAVMRYPISQTDEIINERCDPYALDMHEKTGLINDVKNTPYDLGQIELVILERLNELGVKPYDRKAKTGGIICGSSIAFDTSFLMAQMPTLRDHFHYRCIDVSSVAMLARFWQPEIEKVAIAHKKYTHEALTDIRETIEELKRYKQLLFDKAP